MGKCTKKNCPFQYDVISDNCDLKTCPYRTELGDNYINADRLLLSINNRILDFGLACDEAIDRRDLDSFIRSNASIELLNEMKTLIKSMKGEW